MIKRYEWEDALIDAQVEGRISNGALLVALKLSKAITWVPDDGRQSALYWKNEEAFKAVGLGRSTYFKHRDELFGTGFFVSIRDSKSRDNLHPAIPESPQDGQKSLLETTKVHSRDSDSPQDGLEKSTGDNPYSVEIHCRDTVENNSVDAPVVADAPTVTSSSNSKVKEDDEDVEIIWDIEDYPLTSKAQPTSLNLEVEETPQSTVETIEKSESVYLTPGEEDAWRGICEMYPEATLEQHQEAKRICAKTYIGTIYERAEKAFTVLGVDKAW